MPSAPSGENSRGASPAFEAEARTRRRAGGIATLVVGSPSGGPSSSAPWPGSSGRRPPLRRRKGMTRSGAKERSRRARRALASALALAARATLVASRGTSSSATSTQVAPFRSFTTWQRKRQWPPRIPAMRTASPGRSPFQVSVLRRCPSTRPEVAPLALRTRRSLRTLVRLGQGREGLRGHDGPIGVSTARACASLGASARDRPGSGPRRRHVRRSGRREREAPATQLVTPRIGRRVLL